MVCASRTQGGTDAHRAPGRLNRAEVFDFLELLGPLRPRGETGDCQSVAKRGLCHASRASCAMHPKWHNWHSQGGAVQRGQDRVSIVRVRSPLTAPGGDPPTRPWLDTPRKAAHPSNSKTRLTLHLQI